MLPRPHYETVETGDFTYHAGPNNAWVLRVRSANVAWAREESRRRGLTEIEWWVGWSTPPGIAEHLLAEGMVPDPDEPMLTGMTCAAEPPAAPHVEVRRIEWRTASR